MDATTLKKFGLNEKEAKIYLASLELGYATVQQIANQAEINRATTYVILESLIKKGLATHLTKGKKRYFTAEPPERLNHFLNDQLIKIKRKREKLQKLLPNLKASKVRIITSSTSVGSTEFASRIHLATKVNER